MSVFAPFVFMAVAFGEIDTFKLYKTIPNISGRLVGKFELRIFGLLQKKYGPNNFMFIFLTDYRLPTNKPLAFVFLYDFNLLL